jgi:hypothetical protein
MSAMNRREFLGRGTAAAAATRVRIDAGASPVSTRAQWIAHVERIAGPVLTSLSERRLKATMPVECKPGQEESRRQCTYLEAAGRTLAGVAPWLESASDDRARHFAGMALEGIAAGVDPRSPDYFNFGTTAQSLVDAAFLGLGLLRAPNGLIAKLPAAVRVQLIEGLMKVRAVRPPESNWLLFAAVVEATLEALGAKWESAPVEHALDRHRAWYLGDGTYADGAHFHADFYNSFVIHPFLLAVLESPVGKAASDLRELELRRAVRYAAIQERTIARDGTWPVVGRSIAYRCGAFHLLADMARREQLPEGVSPAQVRCALTAAMHASLGAAGTFDARGWLQIGLAGHQPALGETYISTGSLYLCLCAFLPLGLAKESRFWSDGDAPWTAQKAWAGVDMPADHAINA